MNHYTLGDAIERYRQSLIAKIGEEAATKKVQKLKTVFFQVLYPRMGQPNTSRKANQALLAKIPIHGFIEAYDIGVLEDIEILQARGDKSAPMHRSIWKDFIAWLSSWSNYCSAPHPDAVALLEPKLSFKKKASIGKGMKSRIPPEKPGCTRLVYAVKKEDLPPEWQQHLIDFEKFCHVLSPEEENKLYREGGRKQKKKGMRDISFHNNSLTYLLQYLGWLIRYAINPDTGQPYRFSELTLELLYDIEVLQAYLDWHINVRHNGNSNARHICNVAIKVAQWRLQQSVGIRREDAHPTIQPLMKLRSQYNPNEGHRPRTSVTAIEQRMLEHAECEQVVAHLRARALYFEQQFRDGHGKRKVMEDNWMALNRKRLYFNQSDGCYWCDLLPAEHKTSGDRDYPLFPGPLQEQLTSDFTHYLNWVRPQLPHSFVFFQRRKSCWGKPVNRLSQIVKRIMFNASCELFGEEQGKGMNPHDFRRSLATWFVHYGRTDDVTIFAQLCGHSPEMLLKLYAQVRSREQTKQAPAVFNRTAAREQALKQSGTNQDVRVKLKRLIDAATPDTLAKLLVIVENSFPS